jgi:ABC-type Fe3+ transport system permease subunit
MNRAYLVVGVPGIVVATAYVWMFYGWRAGTVAAGIGAALIAVAILLIRSRAAAPPW